jgi:hypothetical protein
MKNEKSPGSDGFTSEFFKFYRVKSFHNIYEEEKSWYGISLE